MITLRHFKESDLNDFYEYCSVDGVGQLAGWNPHKSIEDSQHILNKFIDEKFMYAIVLNNKVIGNIAFQESWATYPAELGYLAKELGFVLSKDYWGKGIMLQAIHLMLDYGFNELNLYSITACRFSSNIQSKRVLEKVGFMFAQEVLYGPDNLLESQHIIFKSEYKKRNT